METTKQNVILVATDFTPMGDVAVDHGANMAKLMQCKLVVVHVINNITRKNILKGAKNNDPVKEKLKAITQDVKSRYGIESEFLAPEGSIFSSIADVAKQVDATFLFMGTHGKKGVQFLLGSFALKVVQSSPAPMIVVQDNANNNKFKKLVYPLDLEVGSKQKVKWAIFMHKHFGTEVHIVVYNIKDDATQRKLKADLNQVEKILAQHGVPYSHFITNPSGSFEKHILNYAKEQQADAIMISTDPDSLNWNPFGTAPERIMFNKEKIPVVCINSKDLKVIIGGP
jgi:nucleotide-binding universal stress UspA family protein